MKKWGSYLIILGLIVTVIASVAIHGCTDPSNTKSATDNTDTKNADTCVDPWGEMKRQSTPLNVAVITQDKTLVSKLRNNKYPEVNQSAQFDLVLPEHARALLSADAVWIMEDQHEAALDTTTALHMVLEQFARQGKPVVFFGFGDTNKVARAFGDPNDKDIPVEEAPGYETIASFIKFDGNQEIATIGRHVNPANDDWGSRVKSALESTWNARKGAKR